MDNSWAAYLALLSWIFFYVQNYDKLTKTSHKFLIQLSGYGLVIISLIAAYLDLSPLIYSSL